MTEKVIRIEGIDPAELYGVAGSNIVTAMFRLR